MLKAQGMLRCEHVLARLWDFLDGEMEAADESAIKRHLEICNLCYPRYDFRRAYFEFTRRIREKDNAPPELRRRLFEAILEADAKEIDGRQ